MPVGSLEPSIRKPCALETISSKDSTLESRLSGNDIPKMELLKINYVNQCKQVVAATRSSPGARGSAPPVPKHQIETDPSRVYRYLAYKRPSSQPEISRKDHSEVRESPHYESWDFFQNKRAIQSRQPKECEDCRDCCCSDCSDCSSTTADSLCCSPAVEKSHSWNYRTKLAAVKKEEVDVKPRVERYAKIDRIDCVHDVVQMRHQRTPNKPTTKSCSDVSKIQQMFETAVQQRGLMGHRESLDFEPLRKVNTRQADSPRRRTFSPAGSDERIKRLEGLQPYDADCCECRSNRKSLCDLKQLSKTPKKSEPKSESAELSHQKKKMAELKAQFEPKELPNRQFKKCQDWKSQNDCAAPAKNVSDLKVQMERKPSPSRHFKKASEAKTKNDQANRKSDAKSQIDAKDYRDQRIEDSSKTKTETKELTSWQQKKTSGEDRSSRPRNESNEQFNLQIKKMFQSVQETPTISTPPSRNRSQSENRPDESSPSSDIELPQLIDSKMLRKRGGHHQIKVERVHIRKKRQPLLIINQLAEPVHSHDHKPTEVDHIADADSKTRNTCGYKNCTFSNCPMSSAEPHKTIDSDNDHNKKEHLVKENNIRNLEKSSAHTPDKIISTSPATDKKKLSSVEDHRLKDQITIVVNRPPQSDPNDVQNFSNKNITKATTDELLSPSVLNNTIVIRSSSKAKVSNVDVNLKNIENRKFNDLKNINHWVDTDHGDHHRSPTDDHLRNSVKIFVRNYPVSSSSSGDSNSLSDPDDRGRRSRGIGNRILRYDSQQTASGSSRVTLSSSSTADDDDDDEEEDDDDDGTGSALSTDLRKYQSDGSSNCSSSVTVSSSTPVTVQNVFPPTKLGCDGGIFWNNCYFYEGDKSNYCCSAISCEDDNCPYFDLEEDDIRRPAPADQIDGCRREKGHPQKPATHKWNPRKTDVIHDMRPRSMDGVVDSGVSLNGDTGSSPDSEHMQNQQDSEARRLKRGHVLSELLETERIYVTEMSSILKGYCDQMQSEEMMHLVPASLQGKEDILFGNLHELYTFHSDIFLKDLENCISTTELVALCFVQRRDTFYRLYSFYCQNIPRSERLRETLVDTHLFLQECQKRLGHKLPLAAYLLKPVQRITKYQLLLKDLLRFSDSGSCTKELQKALDCMLIVLKCVNDSMHQIAITGFPSDLAQQGELLLQDSFQVWTESKKDIRLRIKPQQRHIFLYQKSMLFCKQTSKTGHNKSTYQFKHYVKTSLIGLTESVRGDPKRFEVWLQGRQEVHTMQAPTLDVKNKWVAEIKRVLLNQLEELKGEKIKQYGLNHRGLRQTSSWDTPNAIILTPQRTMSCDVSSESNRNSNCSSDDSCPPHTPGVSSISSTEKENPDGCGWSSDYSNSEDEMSMIEDNSTPGSRFIALADYNAMGHSEVSMREGDAVELLKVGCAGWWFVRILDANSEGWTPAAYLESINRKSSRSSSRNQE